MLDLQRANAGLVGIGQLQSGDHPAGFVAQRPQFVEFGIVAAPDEAAVALQERQLVVEAGGEKVGEGCGKAGNCSERLADDLRHVLVREQFPHLPRSAGAGEKRTEIARTAAIERQARKRARHVGHTPERGPKIFGEAAFGQEPTDSFQPPVDRLRIGQRRHQPFRQFPPAAAGDRPVDRLEKAARPFARQGAGEFEIGAGRRVDKQRVAVEFALWRFERRPLVDLGLLDIGEGGGCRGQFGARERPEPVEGGDVEIARNAALGGRAVEQHLRLRRGAAAELVNERVLFRVVEHLLRQHDLARLDAHDVGQKPRLPAFGHPETARRDVDPGQPVTRLVRSLDPGERHQVVGFRRREQLFLGQRAGRDEAHHVAFDDGFAAALFGFRRVFHLLADRHAEAERDQFLEIVVGRMHRHAAHRDVAAEMLAALGQRDA